jgi:hypothetical protein
VLRAASGDAADRKPEEEAKEWVDDGSLPLEDEDKLPFFLMDAHEEQATPGTLYLFGKARLRTGPQLCNKMGCSAGLPACSPHWGSAKKAVTSCLACEYDISGHGPARVCTSFLFDVVRL